MQVPSELQGKRVTLVAKLAGQDEPGEISGRIEAVNELAILFRPKGGSQIIMIDSGEIISCTEITPESKKSSTPSLRQKRQDPLTDTLKAKRHLLDSHGYLISWAKSVDDEDALKQHDSIDHGDLGHYHAERAVKSETIEESPQDSPTF